jgi:hypothetical protein
MKNRTIFRLLGLLAVCAVAAASCVDDKGNYTYRDAAEVFPVTIEGLTDLTAMNQTTLRVVPVMDDTGRGYTYSWYVTPTEPGGIMPQKTILSTERDLDILLRLEPRAYFLYFEVFDPAQNNVSIRKRVVLNVTETEINAGWYILKNIDGQTDFDHVNPEGKLYPDVMLNYAPQGERLEGNAVMIAYQHSRYRHQMTLPDGRDTIMGNRRALHILSDRGIRTLDAGSLIRFKDFEDQFYHVPEVCDPRGVYLPLPNYGDVSMNNAGRVYAICGDYVTAGKYSAKPGLYDAHKDMLTALGGVAFFDTVERTFYLADPTGAYIYPAGEPMFGGMAPSPVKMDYTLVSMFESEPTNSGYRYGHAVMQGLSDGKYYLFGVTYDPWFADFANSMGGFLATYDQIPDGCRMPTAEVKASPSKSFIYFADGNKLCVYRNLPGTTEREDVILTFPAGETIDYLMCRADGLNRWSDLVVLTNSAAGWKLYGYEPLGLGNPELKPTPTFTYSGQGEGRHVLYRQMYIVEE